MFVSFTMTMHRSGISQVSRPHSTRGAGHGSRAKCSTHYTDDPALRSIALNNDDEAGRATCCPGSSSSFQEITSISHKNFFGWVRTMRSSAAK